MKTKEQIEELVSKKFRGSTFLQLAFIDGYTTCQEEEVKPLMEQLVKATEILQMTREFVNNEDALEVIDNHLNQLT